MNTENKANICISIFGPFSVTDHHGNDITPSSAKSCALLALVATASGKKRTRTWLQDKLWSDRAPKQAAGSLRQSLVEIRRVLGQASGVLQTDRATVALVPDRLSLASAEDQPEHEREFLQGLDVRDVEFEEWLRGMRGYYTNQRKQINSGYASGRNRAHIPRQRRSIVLVGSGEGGALGRLFETHLLDSVAHSLRELFDLDIMSGTPGRVEALQPSPGALLLNVQAFQMPHCEDRIGLRATVEEASSLRAFWAEQTEVMTPMSNSWDNAPNLALTHRIVQALSEILLREPQTHPQSNVCEADTIAVTAFRKMFTMRYEDLNESWRLLSNLIASQPRGLYYAWRAQLAVIRNIERQFTDIATLRQQCEEDTAKALELEPLNSNVLAAVANAKLYLERDVNLSIHLAHRAVAANRSNPLAWWAWANAALYGGEAETAHTASVTGQYLAERSALKFWADFQRCLSAIVTGREAEAIRSAEAASALAPSFRPPLRYLLALYAKSNDAVRASRVVTKLSALEPDFSVEQMANDSQYPVALMRRIALITPDFAKPIDF